MKKIIVYILLFVCCVHLSANNEGENSRSMQANDSLQTESYRGNDSSLLTDSVFKSEINQLEQKRMKKQEERYDKVMEEAKKILIFVVIGFLVVISFILIGVIKISTLLKKEADKIIGELKRYREQTGGKESHVTNKVQPAKPEEKTGNPKDIGNVSRTGGDKDRSSQVSIATETMVDSRNVQNVVKPNDRGKDIYAKPMQNGCLKVTNDIQEAIYVIRCRTNETTSLGEFFVYDGPEQMLRAIKNRENFLDSFCDARGTSMDARAIRNLGRGEVEKIDNMTWKVIKKLEIEFLR